ncbi:CPBP family intramembrane glutamic endopeptidase [Gracilibacillus salinarum]|uniref:CPBP family intramembrane metalloprotease n=1 Tax=Gracilibacillus salinarum TaxID=2932255 RepID=A0ABY4GSB7_9BACI|nr:type II CAAX endopeptidase family protein [Gracilibacillus salinarum]UOQ87282.1 CPBP family intramembrane metalloprotease [Gracilibacillus salinarum]
MKENLSMKWNYKELIILLILALAFVPVVIEIVVNDLLYLVFENNLYAGTATGLIMAIVFTSGVYIVALMPHNLNWSEVGWTSFSKHYWKWIIVWSLVLIVASILVLIVMDSFNIGVDNSKTASLKQHVTWFTFSIGFISAAIISPVYEEIFYRGFLYKWFRVKWGVGAGLLFSSLIFTLVHIPTYNTLPVNFISGLIFAWTYEKTNSIIPAIIIHGIFNGLGIILTSIS